MPTASVTFENISFVLMDIEGTISDVHFVKDVLFPYSARELRNFVAQNRTSPMVRACLKDAGQAKAQSTAAPSFDDETAILQLLEWIKLDVKHPALKTIQGLIWRKGFTENVFRAHLYPDVVSQWRQWQKQGLRLGIYSSGSVDAQKLFFEYSVEGNVLAMLEAHFDLAVGSKKETSSYAQIADQLQLPARQILFLSDIEAELDAAKNSGLQTSLVARAADAAFTDASRLSKHKTVHSLSDLRVAANPEVKKI